MSLSLSVSSSLDSCVSVVVVDLEACREPSGEAVALHAHEAVGGGRRADCGPNLWGHLCGRRAESTSTGCCRQRAAGRTPSMNTIGARSPRGEYGEYGEHREHGDHGEHGEYGEHGEHRE